MTKENNHSFEALMLEIKTSLDALEKGDLSLEDSMKAYEKGIAHVRAAEAKLSKMEGRMEEILADGSVKDLAIDNARVEQNDAA